MEWAGIGVTLLIAVAGLVRSFFYDSGYSRHRLDTLEKQMWEHAVEDDRDRDLSRQHRENSDAHWTRREREDLVRQIDKIDQNVQAILDRH